MRFWTDPSLDRTVVEHGASSIYPRVTARPDGDGRWGDFRRFCGAEGRFLTYALMPSSRQRVVHVASAAEALRVLHRAALHEQLASAADGPLAAYNERAHAKAARIESEALLTPTSPTGHLVKGGGEIVEMDRGLDGYTEPIPFAIRNDLRRAGKHLR
jgi:hypothetical protein